jgi:nucleoside-diphosphate-sugar epimerase
MNVLVIGGNGFIGSHVVRELKAAGHKVAVFHRGTHPSPGDEEIIGDRNRLPDQRHALEAFAPDVVLDMVLSSRPQAEALIRFFGGRVAEIVAISSMDVYRAAGVLHGTEPGPLQEVPLTENSALRERFDVYPPAAIKMLQSVFTWLDDEYDKVLVERALNAQTTTPVTVLRLPMVYGPGDPLHRLFPLLKRMKDHRPVILIEESYAAWRGPRGYVENVAHAIMLATTAAPYQHHRAYNVAEEPAFSELEWAQAVAKSYGWNGRFLTLPVAQTPAHLQPPGNTQQHWVASSERIRHELRFREIIPLEAALSKTIEWELAHPPQPVNAQQFDYDAEDRALAAFKR